MHRIMSAVGRYIFCISMMIIGLILSGVSPAFAQSSSPVPIKELDKRLGAEERLRAYGPDMFGDGIDPNTGTIVFEHTDISIPGNSHLEVALRRKLSQGELYHPTVNAEFGDWEYAVPRIRSLTMYDTNFRTTNRCSGSFSHNFNVSNAGSKGYIHPDAYSNGLHMDAPGHGSQQLLEGKQGSQWPTTAKYVSTGGWYFTCLSNISGGGEGFLGHAPNGDTYRFDRLIERQASDQVIGNVSNGQVTRYRTMLVATEVRDVTGNWVHYNYDTYGRLTQISSSDGRQIDLGYNGTSMLVASATANNDSSRTWTYGYGRTNQHYPEWSIYGQHLDQSLNRMPHQILRTVQQPDGKSWQLNLDGMAATPAPAVNCEIPSETLTLTHPYGAQGEFKLSQRSHRSSFDVPVSVLYECPNLEPEEPGHPDAPFAFQVTKIDTLSVTSKKITGSGLSTLLWNYDYEQSDLLFTTDWQTWKAVNNHTSSYIYDPFDVVGTSSNDRTNWTIVTTPSGNKIKYYHFWTMEPAGGKLDRKEELSASNQVLRTTKYSYVLENQIGTTNRNNTRNVQQPVRTTKTVITQDGDTYTTENDYNLNHGSSTYSFGSPIASRVYSNVNSAPRETVTTYEHNKPKWVLGLPKTVTVNNRPTWTFDYDDYGRKESQSHYGALHANFGYYPVNTDTSSGGTSGGGSTGGGGSSGGGSTGGGSGGGICCTIPGGGGTGGQDHFRTGTNDKGKKRTSDISTMSLTASDLEINYGGLSWIEDALGRRTTFANWKRGNPQQITRPDGVNIYQYVENNGWLTTSTNGNGNSTSYLYDNMGRLKTINPPGDWVNTNIAYNFTSSGPIQTITRGNGKTTVNYDLMFRPVLERTQATDTGWSSYVKTAYGTNLKPSFKSFPSSSSNPTTGTDFTYDGLGRILTERENVSPYAQTTHAYYSSHRHKVIDPSGAYTNYYSYGYDGPDNKDYRAIYQRGDNLWLRRTAINKNIWGQTTSIRQWGDLGGDQTRYYYYNNKQQVCRYREKEGGDTVYDYNAAGELVAYQKGLSNGTNCPSPTGTAKVSLTYDLVGRLNNTSFSHSSTPDISRTFDNNGNILTMNRGSGTSAVNWTYTYDANNQLLTEKLDIDGRNYDISYVYNDTGAITRRTLPEAGISPFPVTYDVDGLGRPLKVRYGSYHYANNIGYHPSGTVSSMTHQNGHTFTRTLNSRQLPQRLLSQYGSLKALDLNYNYDARGLVTSITDGAVSGNNRTFTYDGLGQLKTTTGPWGSGTHNYDSIGNLKSRTLGSRSITLNYDTRNRVSKSIDTGGWGGNTGTRTVAYDARGNVTSLGNMAFVYDYSDQPTAVSGVANGNYTYDGNLKRVKSVVNGKTIYNVYDASGSLVHIHKINDNEKITYIPGPEGPVAMAKNGKAFYPHKDHLGSPVAGTKDTGAIDWRERYSPFGITGDNPTPLNDQAGFTGHIKDAATGLNYMQARYYDSVMGRFLSVDPIIYSGKVNTGQFNRYTYTWNNPINLFDPDGKYVHTTCYSNCGYRFLLDPDPVQQRYNSEGDGSNTNAGTTEVVKPSGIHAKGNPAKLRLVAASAVLVADDATGIGVADDPAIPVLLGTAAVIAADEQIRTHVTYTLRNDEGQVYIGRTSGYGSPQALVNFRYIGHHRRLPQLGGFHSPLVDRAVRGVGAYNAIRGREQMMIDAHGGVASPKVGNSINGISMINPNRGMYISAATAAFGPAYPTW